MVRVAISVELAASKEGQRDEHVGRVSGISGVLECRGGIGQSANLVGTTHPHGGPSPIRRW